MQDEVGTGSDAILWLAPDERQWLAQTLSIARSRDIVDLLAAEPDSRMGGARRFRAVLLALSLDDSPEDLPVTVTHEELWALDMHLMEYDLRDTKLPSGRLLVELARKVWSLITEVHRDDLPPLLQKGTDHAPEDSDTDEVADAVAEAEALLRPAEDAGTG
jgi:hypothetical protein